MKIGIEIRVIAHAWYQSALIDSEYSILYVVIHQRALLKSVWQKNNGYLYMKFYMYKQKHIHILIAILTDLQYINSI